MFCDPNLCWIGLWDVRLCTLVPLSGRVDMTSHKIRCKRARGCEGGVEAMGAAELLDKLASRFTSTRVVR